MEAGPDVQDVRAENGGHGTCGTKRQNLLRLRAASAPPERAARGYPTRMSTMASIATARKSRLR